MSGCVRGYPRPKTFARAVGNWKALFLATTAVAGVVPMTGTAVAQSSAASNQSPASGQHSFQIPPQPLGSAMAAFSRATGLSVLADGTVSRGVASPGVTGSYSAETALQQLLAGTGLTYSISGSTARVVDPNAGGNSDAAAVPGAIALDTIDVSGGIGTGGMTPDTPYQTPGSKSHVSREQLDRVPPTSPGDVFLNTPGVINAGNRVGTSINPNIRGLQGMGRVNVTIDGARQSTSSYRGYIGNRDETYIDPDMVGGIDISKGPSDGVGVGGIGGSIGFRTLDAGDILRPGEAKGSRVKASTGTNTSSVPDEGTSVSAERPSFLGETFSGSFATAVRHDNYEGVIAYSKRKQGNYFAGTKLPDGLVVTSTQSNLAQVQPGGEVFNTSEDTDSFLAKGKLKGEEQSLELSYLYYGSAAGQINDLWLTTGISPNTQYEPTNTRVDTYTAKYRYTPTDNPFVNVRANLWMSDLFSDRFLGTFVTPYGTREVGGDIGNTSVFSTALGELTLDAGAEFVREHATAEQFASLVTGSNGWETYGPSGVRLMTSVFSNASLKATDWLTLSGGLRFDRYNSEGEGYLAEFPESSGSRASPNASLVITPMEGVQLYGQYVEGYRPPSLRESHWHYQGLLVNNPDLRPELSENKEVGLNILRNDVALANDTLRFKASYFDNTYDDYIIRYLKPRVPGQAGNVYHWANIDSAAYRGFELSGGYDARWFFVEGAFTKYTKIEYCPTATTCSAPKYGTVLSGSTSPTASDYASNYVPPEYSGSITVGIRAFDEKLTLGARTHFAGVRFGSEWTTANASRVGIDVTWPKYQIFDVFGSYKLTEDAEINFSVENITDEYYFGALASVGLPSPGRTVRLGLTRHLDGEAIPSVPDLTLGRAAEGTPGSNWTGLYLGGQLGYAFASLDGVTTDGDGTPGGIPATESANIDLDDLQMGFQVGVNYQLANRMVLGLEGDFSWLRHTGTQEALVTEDSALAQAGWLQADTEYTLNWLATLRGRVGYAHDRYLIYGTGGIAFLKEDEVRTQFQSDRSTEALPYGRSTVGPFKESASETRLGWTAGAGFEYALNNNWSLKGEYTFAGFAAQDFLFPDARAGVSAGYDLRCTPIIQCIREGKPLTTHVPGSFETTNGRKASNELELHTAKIGLNYRF
jgi:hemoglobin/transferrin/lactoferrin receptor protein